MAKRPPLNRKQFAVATSFFYHTDTGKRLVAMLPGSHEPDISYLRRVNRLQPPSRPDDLSDAGMPFWADRATRAKRTVEEIEADIQRNLDRFAYGWITLGEQFLAAAEDADPERLKKLAAEGADINYRDPRTFATALHYVAAQGARPALRALLKIGGCDFLLRDKWKRLASEMAGVYGDDLAMERLLLKKEIRQARDGGIPLDRIYRRDARSGPAQTIGS
jgi:ankyrin repeat protein